MPLHRLYQPVTASGNPSYLTGLLPGGAGVQVAGTTANPGISAPRLEESAIEVLDVTAPTLIASNGTTLSTPAPQGKLLVLSTSGSQGARWKLNSTVKQAVARGQYGVVVTAASAQTSTSNDAGFCVSTPTGNEAQYGSKAVVMYDGPVQAYVQGTVGGIAISAGMPLVADGAGNLTAASSPGAGTVLATMLGPTVANTVSVPVLTNVYMGGY